MLVCVHTHVHIDHVHVAKMQLFWLRWMCRHLTSRMTRLLHMRDQSRFRSYIPLNYRVSENLRAA